MLVLDGEGTVAYKEIVAEVTEERDAISHQINLGNKALIEAAGATIRQLTAEQRTRWVEAMRPVWDRFADEIGEDMIEAAVASNVM